MSRHLELNDVGLRILSEILYPKYDVNDFHTSDSTVEDRNWRPLNKVLKKIGCCNVLKYKIYFGQVLADRAGSVFRRHRWKAISPIGIDVTVPWSVCLLCLCIVLKRQKISIRFLLHTTVPRFFQIALKFGLHLSTIFSPNVVPKWPIPLLSWATDTFDRKLRSNG